MVDTRRAKRKKEWIRGDNDTLTFNLNVVEKLAAVLRMRQTTCNVHAVKLIIIWYFRLACRVIIYWRQTVLQK